MNVELTVTDKKIGYIVCENERYDFAELRASPGFSDDERCRFLDLVPLVGAVTFEREDTIFRVVRV